MKLKTSVDLSFPENGRFIDRISLEALANSDAIFGVGVGEMVSNGLLLSSLGGSERLKNSGRSGSSSSVALVRDRVLLVLVLSVTGAVSLFSSFVFSDIEPAFSLALFLQGGLFTIFLSFSRSSNSSHRRQTLSSLTVKRFFFLYFLLNV